MFRQPFALKLFQIVFPIFRCVRISIGGLEDGWMRRKEGRDKWKKLKRSIRYITNDIAKSQQHILEIPPTLTDPFLLRRTDTKYKHGRWWLRESGGSDGKCIDGIVISFTRAICVRALAFRLDLSRGANAVWPWWCARWIPGVSLRSIFALHFNKKSMPKSQTLHAYCPCKWKHDSAYAFPGWSTTFAKSSSPAFILGIGPTEEERVRQRKRDFAAVLTRSASLLVVYRNEELLYARRVFVNEKRCRKDGAISRRRPAMTPWTPAATRSINQSVRVAQIPGMHGRGMGM